MHALLTLTVTDQSAEIRNTLIKERNISRRQQGRNIQIGPLHRTVPPTQIDHGSTIEDKRTKNIFNPEFEIVEFLLFVIISFSFHFISFHFQNNFNICLGTKCSVS